MLGKSHTTGRILYFQTVLNRQQNRNTSYFPDLKSATEDRKDQGHKQGGVAGSQFALFPILLSG